MPGALVISLDFELHWGVRDHLTVAQYKENLLGERVAVPALIELFSRRSIHATWATVGMLFCETKKELIHVMPARLPTYADVSLSPYRALSEIGSGEADDPVHYAPSLVRKIAEAKDQELATHTFSHFYCLEDGQTAEDFDADLEVMQSVGARFGDVNKSLVFPRNQYNPAYRGVMKRRGVVAFRSNGAYWAYSAKPAREENPLRRATRLLDAYVSVSGARAHTISRAADGLVDVPASAFLRPYSPRLRHLDRARLLRITRSMGHAAEAGRAYHLWWHPHNFGVNLRENMEFLEAVLDAFDALRRRHGMESLTMREAAETASAPS